MQSINKLLSDGAAAGDRPVVFLPREYLKASSPSPVVFLPGTGDLWQTAFSRAIMYSIAEAVCNAGHPFITTDAGVDEFGNARARAGIDAALTWAFSDQVGVRTGKVHMSGFSQGGGAALSWIGTGTNRADRTHSYTGFCPLVNLNTLVGQGGATKAAIDAAYPSAYVEATHGAANNPQTMAVAGKYGSLPMVIAGTSDDPVIPPADQLAFKNAVGASAVQVNLGANGHNSAVPNLPLAVSTLLARIGSL